jgi:hypothetical protein
LFQKVLRCSKKSQCCKKVKWFQTSCDVAPESKCCKKSHKVGSNVAKLIKESQRSQNSLIALQKESQHYNSVSNQMPRSRKQAHIVNISKETHNSENKKF